jgi:acetyl esterase/lipase
MPRTTNAAAPLRRAARALGVCAACAACAAGAARAQAPAPAPPEARTSAIAARELAAIPLWPGGAPGARGDSAVDRPTITPFLPTAPATGAAVVIFPGGGYQHLAVEHEGAHVARWLASLGVTAFVVRYRLGPRYRHPAMLHDARRAVRLVRARAAEWGVDTARVGVLGFSAGGHLASTAGTQFEAGARGSADAVERASSRPDLLVLVYPVITMDSAVTHAGSRRNLLGERPAPELARAMSSETRVTRETPPTFIVASTDDTAVPVENSLRFYQALRGAGVPAELHVFESGRHGFGLAPQDPVLARWLALCEAWLGRRGWVAARRAP